jgi:hypothetical protein
MPAFTRSEIEAGRRLFAAGDLDAPRASSCKCTAPAGKFRVSTRLDAEPLDLSRSSKHNRRRHLTKLFQSERSTGARDQKPRAGLPTIRLAGTGLFVAGLILLLSAS